MILRKGEKKHKIPLFVYTSVFKYFWIDTGVSDNCTDNITTAVSRKIERGKANL